ncbi:Dyp-type peroxidase [Geodermatophilus sp. SYSU D01180]
MTGVAIAGDQLQEGIYFRSGTSPGHCYRLLLLHVIAGTPAEDARRAVSSLWRMLADLKDGVVEDLRATRPGDPQLTGAAGGGLTVLIGYGARFFSSTLHSPRLTSARRPPALHTLAGPPSRADQPAPFRQLHWAATLAGNAGEADLAMQFIGDTELVVNRAVVEVRKRIRRPADPLPLSLVTFFAGFHREDRRSWIDFHDGVNTLTEAERRSAMVVRPSSDTPWLDGGTYMTFLKIAVDLDAWQQLDRSEQEVLVGRDKLTGCPVERFDQDDKGRPVPRLIATCPGTATIPPSPPPEYIDPPRPDGRLAQGTHIHRSNLNRGDPGQDANNRVYRQGYEFLDPATLDIHAGLNFVSFQRTTKFIENILDIPKWMGEVNFGGPAEPEPSDPRPIELMSLLAGGFYAVPPQGDPFPGADLFDSSGQT